MKLHMQILIFMTGLTLATSGALIAAEPDHSGHAGQMQHPDQMQQTMQPEMDHSKHAMPMDHSQHAPAASPQYRDTGEVKTLDKLNTIPPSGRAREAGFDGRYAMEPTSAQHELATLCANGSRGLIMLDNATWDKCGGKSEGASKGPGHYPAMPPWNKEGTGDTFQMDHSMMGH